MRPTARTSPIAFVVVALVIPNCRSACIQDPEYIAEQLAPDAVIHVPPERVWQALRPQMDSRLSCGRWPEATPSGPHSVRRGASS